MHGFDHGSVILVSALVPLGLNGDLNYMGPGLDLAFLDLGTRELWFRS